MVLHPDLLTSIITYPMNPSKEALDAAQALRCKVQKPFGWQPIECSEMAAIIDRHFEPLRRDNATLAGRLTAAELERDSLGARAEKAEAEIERWRTATAKLRDGADEAASVATEQLARAEQRVAELAGALRALSQAVHAKIQVQGADGNYVLSMDVASADKTLARHAAGEPAQEACGGRCGDPLCNLSTEGELMREPAKHPDEERLNWLEEVGDVTLSRTMRWVKIGRVESCERDQNTATDMFTIQTQHMRDYPSLRAVIDAGRKQGGQ